MQRVKIILASQSKQRKLLMQSLNLDFEIQPANLDESQIQTDDQIIRAQLIAQAKAQAVAKQNPNSLVIAADTYGLLEGKPLEKPQDINEAKEMLKAQSGQWIQAVTGFCFVGFEGEATSGTQVTQVKFRKLLPAEIDHYVNQHPVMTWSAAFAPTYPSGAALIEEIEGSFTGFTYGLPIENLVPFLNHQLGLS
ncbi:MAG: hypothetical protein GF381_03150 [Candidatus Pacebacteria bacterium]|nr:hypothetical protein [Candidatus Paceibacterota bacterium]